jgi:hypothetical protein
VDPNVVNDELLVGRFKVEPQLRDRLEPGVVIYSINVMKEPFYTPLANSVLVVIEYESGAA